jgi:chromosome segregation ATPase
MSAFAQGVSGVRAGRQGQIEKAKEAVQDAAVDCRELTEKIARAEEKVKVIKGLVKKENKENKALKLSISGLAKGVAAAKERKVKAAGRLLDMQGKLAKAQSEVR